MMMKYCSLIILLLCLVAGCGKGHVTLKGKVTFADDGSPLTLGTVVLSTPSYQSRGDLNDKGEFVPINLFPRRFYLSAHAARFFRDFFFYRI